MAKPNDYKESILCKGHVGHVSTVIRIALIENILRTCGDPTDNGRKANNGAYK